MTEHGKHIKPSTRRALHGKDRQRPGFDIVRLETVGRVTFGEGDTSAVEAAFAAVGQHVQRTEASGTYTFPHEDGGVIRIEVAHDPAAPMIDHDLS